MIKEYKKNQILCNKELFNTALDKLTTVNEIALNNRIERETKIDLNILLTANDKEFKPLLTQYCNKTGRELRNLDIDNLKLLIAVHGRSEALELMRLDACAQYSPLWLHSEPKTLNKLMYFDPQGFFIYAASNIFHNDLIKHSNIAKAPPMSQAGKESTEDANLLNFLNEFPNQDKPEDFLNFDMLADVNVRYFNLQDKIIANRNLNLYHEELNVTEINELLRRFLGLANPSKVANLVKFSFEYLYEVTESSENLEQFKNELIEAIKTLFNTHFKKIKNKKIEGYKMRMQNANSGLIHSGSIAEIKAKFGGLSHFHNQPKIRNHTTKESILYDLKSFWDKETENNDLLKDFAGRGHSNTFDANSKGLDFLTGEPLNRHETKQKAGSFKLNIKKPE